jgi:hypothetical protein
MRVIWSNWWNEDWQGKPKYSEKTCPSPSPTLSTTNSTWPDPGLNPGRRSGKPATNLFSYGAARDYSVNGRIDEERGKWLIHLNVIWRWEISSCLKWKRIQSPLKCYMWSRDRLEFNPWRAEKEDHAYQHNQWCERLNGKKHSETYSDVLSVSFPEMKV